MRIAFSGKMTSGKTALANYLVDEYQFTKIRFADAIYDIMDMFMKVYKDMGYRSFQTDLRAKCYQLLPKKEDAEEAYKQLYTLYLSYFSIGKDIQVKDPDYRDLMQIIGTKIMRGIEPFIWINYTDKFVREHVESNIVIDDLRFNDEYLSLQYLDFTLVRLDLDFKTQLDRVINLYGQYNLANLLHRSEVELDDKKFHYYISSEQQLQDMYKAVDRIIIDGGLK